MDKKKAYVFGCGQYFKKKEQSIIESYDIEAVLDNHKEGTIELINGRFVPILKPDQIDENKDIPIILMVYDFYSVWESLKELPIDADRIIFPNIFFPFMNGEQAFYDDGEFQLLDGYIYYVNRGGKYKIDSAETLKDLPRRLERERIDASFIIKQAPEKPLNREFGFSRGTPIDRFYIEKWLERNKKIIKGDVLEIAEDTYTKRFGEGQFKSHVLHVNSKEEGIIKGNLETGEGIVENSMDCIILTQTLPFIYKFENVISNLFKMLRKGGTALITMGGITQISRYDMDRWGHFWSFTTASVKRLIEESRFEKNYDITVYGNVKTACALLYGVAAEELTMEELEYIDEDYPVSICVVAQKP